MKFFVFPGAALALFSLLAGCARVKEKKPTASSIVADTRERDVVNVRKLMGYDYMGNLQRAVTGDERALGSLFQFTDSEGFIGAAADDHCVILKQLLELLGDDKYSRVLAGEPLRIRKAVISALDYAAWDPQRYPRTNAVSPRRHMTNMGTVFQ